MNWIFSAFVVAAVIHVLEEYAYPGGFSDWMRSLNPRFAPWITARFAVIINGLFVLLCVMGAMVASKGLVFSLSVASLLFFNGLIHLAGTIRAKRYAPGVISGVLLYVPLSLYAFYLFAGAGRLTLVGSAIAGLLGVLYQAVPIGYLGLSSMARRA
jgi:small-conductance mechanosensitive channel